MPVKFSLDHAMRYQCVYCGMPALHRDHHFPHIWLSRGANIPRVYNAKVCVWACESCNVIKSGTLFPTAGAVCEHIAERLLRKHARLLAGEDWEDEDLEELGPGLRGYVESGVAKKEMIRERITVLQQNAARWSEVEIDNRAWLERVNQGDAPPTGLPQPVAPVPDKACPECGNPVSPHRNFCSPECRAKAKLRKRREELPNCQNCGRLLSMRGQKFCGDPECMRDRARKQRARQRGGPASRADADVFAS